MLTLFYISYIYFLIYYSQKSYTRLLLYTLLRHRKINTTSNW
jgi:hypothetical protein